MESRRIRSAWLAPAALALLVGTQPEMARAQVEPGPPVGRIVADTVPAPSLAGNLLRDPAVQPAWVYLPPGYGDAKTRYPVLYLLHGVLDDPSVWIEPVYQGMTIPATMDSLIAAGAIRPMIVVMPNGRNALGGSYYRNSTVTGGWGDYIARDLVRHVDARYRTLGSAGGRAIAGHSMGGLGAIWAGMLLLYPSGDIPEPDNSGRFGRFTFKPKCDEGREFSRYSVVRLRREASKEERFGPTDHEEDEGGVAVQDSDPLVIDSRYPRPETGLRSRAAEDGGGFFGSSRHSRVSKKAMRESISSWVRPRSGM